MFCKENLFQGKEYLNLLRKGFFFFFLKAKEKSFWKKSFVNDFILFYFIQKGNFQNIFCKEKEFKKEIFFPNFLRKIFLEKTSVIIFSQELNFQKRKRKKGGRVFFFFLN